MKIGKLLKFCSSQFVPKSDAKLFVFERSRKVFLFCQTLNLLVANDLNNSNNYTVAFLSTATKALPALFTRSVSSASRARNRKAGAFYSLLAVRE